MVKFTQFCRKFLAQDIRANVAPIFAVAIFGILAAAGLAIDTQNVRKVEDKLQAITDAAALAIAKEQMSDETQMRGIAQAFIAGHPDLAGIQVESVARDGNTYSVGLSRQTPTYLMHLFGKDSVNVRTQSETTYAIREFNLALVLDTTGSMQGTKIATLRNAATTLVDTLDGQGGANTRISVVPFGQYVNVGMSRRNAPWMDVPNDTTTTGPRTCRMVRDVTSRSSCRQVASTCTNDGVTRSCTRRVCDTTYSRPYERCQTPTRTTRWYGCAGSRNAPFHLRADYNGRQIPGAMNVRCGSEMMPLNGNMNQVRNSIRRLNATGVTYIPSGIAWGWRTLTPNAPFTEVAGSDPTTERYMVIMTDGANTRSKDGLTHTGRDVIDANTVTRDMCRNVKADGIQIYTIAYEVTDPATRTLMRDCASDPSMFFDAASAAQLNGAFQDIADSLLQLRLTN